MKAIGIDIISITRIRKLYNKYGIKFLKKILTEKEIDMINKIISDRRKIEKFSGIFAAKEAVIKCFNGNIFFKDITIAYNEFGKPYAMVKDKKILISISHEKDYSIAIAFLK